MEGQSFSNEVLADILDEVYEELNFTEPFTFNTSYKADDALKCQSSFPSLYIFFSIFYLLVFLLAVPGNVIVGLVVGSSRHSLSPSDTFLFHLALADLLLALTLPLSSLSTVLGWVFGNAACKLVNMALEVNFYTSILFLVCISADRYMVVVHAAKEGRSVRVGRQMTIWISCICVWTLGVVLSLPAAVYSETYPSQYDANTTECGEHYSTDSATEWRLVTRGLRFLLGFALPLGAMLGFYGVTVARLVRTRGLRKQRAMRVIVAVVVAFLLCWSPYHLSILVDTLMRAKLIESSCQRKAEITQALQATHSLALLHCCINPVLYAFVGEKFRSNLKRLLHMRRVPERGSMSRFSRSTSSTSQDRQMTIM